MKKSPSPDLLYVGEFADANTCWSRHQGLVKAGLRVEAWDAFRAVRSQFRIDTFLSHRSFLTPRVILYNLRLRHKVTKNMPPVVWVDKGIWMFPATLRNMKRQGAKLIHYSTDDIYDPGAWNWMLRRGRSLYDLSLTTNRFNVGEISSRFGIRAVRAGMGYDASIHRPFDRNVKERTCDVVFVGHWEAHTEEYCVALRNAGFRLLVHGHGWWRARDPQLRATVPLPQSRYSETIAAAKFGLCSLSKRGRNESTGRSFEIPAIGTCMLAPRTSEHEYLFHDREEAILFDGAEQLVNLTREYTDSDAERERIAANGHARIQALRVTWADHMIREWAIAAKILGVSNCEKAGFDEDDPFWPGYRSGVEWKGGIDKRI